MVIINFRKYNLIKKNIIYFKIIIIKKNKKIKLLK